MKFRLFTLSLLMVACSNVTPTPTVTPVSFIPPTNTALVGGSVTPTVAATQTVTVTTGLPTPQAPTNLSFTNDGATLAATYYPPILQSADQRAPGVLLLHQMNGSRNDWHTLALKLQSQGLAVLAVDLRGHGQSTGPADWSKAPGDVRVMWDAMIARPEVDAGRSAIVGASIGANLALIVGANNRDVVTVIALSPGLDYQGVKPLGVLPNFEFRPVFLIASQDDSYSYTSVQQLAPAAKASDTLYYTKAGHGTAMLTEVDLTQQILNWLQTYLGVSKG